MKIKSSRNGEINILFTDIYKSCPSCKFSTSQICILALFVKIKFSGKFPDLQYFDRKTFVLVNINCLLWFNEQL